MELQQLKKLREAVDRMNKMPTSSSGYQQLRYEIIPRIVMPDILFFISCAEKVMNEQKEML